MKKIGLLTAIALFSFIQTYVFADDIDKGNVSQRIDDLLKQVDHLRSQQQASTPEATVPEPTGIPQEPVGAEEVKPRTDYTCRLNCSQNPEESLAAELSSEWLTKMETSHPCEYETVAYLTHPVLMTDIVQSLAKLTKDNDCRERIPDLIKDIRSWKSTFNHLQDTSQCPPHTKPVIEEYAVQSSVGVYVRDNPLLGTRSQSLAKLSPGHRLQLLRRIHGANNESWGEFRYKQQNDTHQGWISMQHVRALQ